MYKRQKIILIESAAIVLITLIAVGAMINIKDWVNRSEAMRAMEQLSQKIALYQQTYHSIPPQSYVSDVKETLQGHIRLGNLKYRSRWIDFDSAPDEILAYSQKNCLSPLLDDGYVVLRLGGTVQWLPKQQFENELARRQRQKKRENLRP